MIKQQGSKRTVRGRWSAFTVKDGRKSDSVWFFVHQKTLEDEFKHEQRRNKSEVDRWVNEAQTKKTTTKKHKD